MIPSIIHILLLSTGPEKLLMNCRSITISSLHLSSHQVDGFRQDLWTILYLLENYVFLHFNSTKTPNSLPHSWSSNLKQVQKIKEREQSNI